MSRADRKQIEDLKSELRDAWGIIHVMLDELNHYSEYWDRAGRWLDRNQKHGPKQQNES